jgi:hypothetical protein
LTIKSQWIIISKSIGREPTIQKQKQKEHNNMNTNIKALAADTITKTLDTITAEFRTQLIASLAALTTTLTPEIPAADDTVEAPAKRKPGRPAGSKKVKKEGAKDSADAPAKHPGRPRKTETDKEDAPKRKPGRPVGSGKKDKVETVEASKRPTTKDGRSGSQFIRDYDAKRRGPDGEFLAKGPEVVEACAKAGLEIALPQVYNVRQAVVRKEEEAAMAAKKAAKKAAKTKDEKKATKADKPAKVGPVNPKAAKADKSAVDEPADVSVAAATSVDEPVVEPVVEVVEAPAAEASAE